MKKLRVCHAIFSQKIGRNEALCADLANAQRSAGLDVTVLVSRGAPVVELLSDHIDVHEVCRSFARPLHANWLLHRLRPDIVHFHRSGFSCVGPVARRTTRIFSCGNEAQTARQMHFCGVLAACRDQLKPAAMPARAIPGWLPNERLRRQGAASSLDIRDELFISRNAQLVLSVARLEYKKGIKELIRAFLEFAPKGAHLLLVGEGSLRSELETAFCREPRIHFLGFRWDVQSLLRQCHVFVHSSRSDFASQALVEAVCSGIPIVATATKASLEILKWQPVHMGPPRNHVALGTAIASELERQRSTGERRVEYSTGRFDRGRCVDSVMELYAQARGITTRVLAT